MYRYRQLHFVICGTGESNDAETTQAPKAASAEELRFLLEG